MDLAYDVIVIGSGSAGLVAALRAASAGLQVLVLEKTGLLGGTSAMSGAGIWIPANHVAARAGHADSRQEALDYLASTLPHGWFEREREMLCTFVETAPRALAFVEAHTPLTFVVVEGEPDPYAERKGGKIVGRLVSPVPLSRKLAGKYRNNIRRSTINPLFAYDEIVRLDPYHHPLRAALSMPLRLLGRLLWGSAGLGTALMIGLVRGCMDAGCAFRLDSRVDSLSVDADGRVDGVSLERGGRYCAARGVVLASGGFEWNTNLFREHFPGPVDRLGSPRANEGDGQRMAAAVGARLDHMDQANVFPCLPTVYEGRPHGLPVTYQAENHAIVVNRHGCRFVSENDFNIGEVLDQRDSFDGAPVHLPAWLIADARYRRHSPLFRWYASYDRTWTVTASSVEELAVKIGVDPQALSQTVARFNRFCDLGRDEDFGRGERAWERYKAHGEPQALGRIEKPPFIAMSFNRSIIGTKGGARTDKRGAVLRHDGSVIRGLYACGLAMANPLGTRAVGSGTTLGPNISWGFTCAESILAEGADDQNGGNHPCS